MGQSQYKPIPKSIGLQLQELAHGLQVIRDSLQAIEQGQLYQFVPLYGQLRALLTQKEDNPLLFTLADELEQNLQVFRAPSSRQKLEKLGLSDENISFLLEGFPVTLEQKTDEQVAVSLREFLESDIITYKEKGYSLDWVIRRLANKAGGAHYDTEFRKHLAEMLSFRFGNQPALKNALKQVAEVVLKLGVQLLQAQMTCYIHTVFYLRKESIEAGADVLAHVRPGSKIPSVFFGFDNELTPTLGILSPEGIAAEARIDTKIDWNEPQACTLSIELTEDLSTRLAVSLGGEVVASDTTSQILFILGHPSFCDIHVGHSIRNDTKNPAVGIATHLIIGETDEPNLRGKLALWSAQKFFGKSGRWVYYGENGYGKIPAGEGNMETVGQAPLKSLKEIKADSVE